MRVQDLFCIPAMRNVHPQPATVWAMADLDLRLVRYFIAVAEHQNIGRAAAELRVAQPSLSRQIQRLEEQLGVRLLDRTSHGSRLTEAGRVFLAEAADLVEAARHAVTTTRAATSPGKLTVGYAPGFIITPAVRDLRERHPGAEIHTRYLTWEDARSLPQYRVDAIVGWYPFPFPTDGARVTVLYEDPRVLVVPVFHRLAGRASVTVADFADEPMADFAIPGASAEWLAFWWLGRSEGSRLHAGPMVHTVQDKFELVASGQALVMHPRGDGHSLTRPDLTTIPIEGIPPCRAVVVTRLVEDNSLVAEFLKSASTYITGQTAVD
jgi:DNA-binding transcriptional LysR family regulator